MKYMLKIFEKKQLIENLIYFQRKSKKYSFFIWKLKINTLYLLRIYKHINNQLIRKNKIFTESQLQQLRNDRLVTQDTLNKICTILECQPGYLLEYLPDETTKDFEEKILTYINK